MTVFGQLGMVESRNAFIVLSILLLCVYAISKAAFPKVFSDLISLDKLFGFKIREDLGSNLRPFGSEQFYFTALYSFSMSFVTLYLVNTLINPAQLPSIFLVDHFAMAIIQWIVLGVILNLLSYLKFLLIFIFGTLFELGSSVSRHFVDMINASLFFSLIMAVLLTIASFSTVVPNVRLLELSVSLTLIFYYYRSFLLFGRLVGERTHSKLYIFSYICATELTPLTIGLVLIITSQI
jgi:hypothetical protein